MSTFRDLTTTKTAEVLRLQAALLDHVSDAVIAVSPAGIVTSWNTAAETIYGRKPEQALHSSLADAVGSSFDPERVLRRGGVLHTTHFTSDGSPLSVRVAVAATDNGHVLVCADLTALRRAERYFEAVVTALDAGVVVFNPDGSIEAANPAAWRIGEGVNGVASAFAKDVPLIDVDGRLIAINDTPLRRAIELDTPQTERVVGIDRPDGTRIWLSVSARLLTPNYTGQSPVLCSFVDVTTQKLASEQLAHAARHDTLTGLPNRLSALAKMNSCMLPGATPRLSAVLFIDIDNLKTINDSYGHSAGDAVLKTAAARMRDALRVGDVLARLAGDEFIAVLSGRVDRPSMTRLTDALHRAVSKPILYGSAVLQITASIGVALVGVDDTRDELELLRSADEAMYAAKASGRDRTCYAP